MVENSKIFDLILQNSASKKEWIVSGLTNTSETYRYYMFEDMEMPEDMPNGEYYYVLVRNARTDVEYTLKDDILDSVITTEEGEIKLRDIQPEVGILRYGDVSTKNTYRNKNTDFLYRK